MNMINEIDLNFGILKIFDGNVAAIEIQEGVEVARDDVLKVIQNAEKNISGSYGLISDRKSRYSTDVIKLYKVLSSRDRLKCAAIVAYRDFTMQMFDQEKKIEEIVSKGTLPLQLFESFEDAVKWVRGTLEDQKIY